MKAKAKSQYKNDVPDLEAGTYDARLMAIVNRGIQENKSKLYPEKAPTLTVSVIFELVDEQVEYKKKDEDGEIVTMIGNRTVMKNCTFSANEKAWFRKTVDALLVSAPELIDQVYGVDADGDDEIDCLPLIGLACMVSIKNGKEDNKTYFDSVVGMSPKKSLAVADATLDQFIFNPYESEFMALGEATVFWKGMAPKILAALDVSEFSEEAIEFLTKLSTKKDAKKPAAKTPVKTAAKVPVKAPAAPVKPTVKKAAAPVKPKATEETEAAEGEDDLNDDIPW